MLRQFGAIRPYCGTSSPAGQIGIFRSADDGSGRERDVGLTVESDRTRQNVFDTARSHSTRVRVAKIVLPVIAAAATGYVWISRAAPGIAVDLAQSAVKDGKLIMANPKLDGYTADERPYSVRAARAIQDLEGGAIDLEGIQATVPMDGGVDARIIAPEGTYDSDKNTLDIGTAFSIETSDGMRAELNSAAVDLKAGSMSTPDPVRISMPSAVIEADSMRITENGKRLIFESRVKLVVEPGALKRAEPGTQDAAKPGD